MLITVLVSAVLIGLDQWLKYLAVQNLTAGSVRVLIPHVLGLTYVENDGAAFNLFSGSQMLLIVVTAVALLAFAAVLLFRRPKDKFTYLAMLLIFAGGVGNLIDRVHAGYVVDYLAFLFIRFPVFNLADICVVVGFFLWAFVLIRDEIRQRRLRTKNEGVEAVAPAADKAHATGNHSKYRYKKGAENIGENSEKISGITPEPNRENGAYPGEDHGEA